MVRTGHRFIKIKSHSLEVNWLSVLAAVAPRLGCTAGTMTDRDC